MNELVIATYILILQEGLMEHDKQEAAGRFLLEAITTQQAALTNTDLTSKKISRLVNRKDPVPDDIKQASRKKAVQTGVIRYFKEQVLPDINPFTRYDTLEKLRKVIEQDTVIAERQKKEFYDLYDKDDQCGFLAQTFLYSLQRNNKKEADAIEPQDVPLLAQVNWECPLSQTRLVDNIDGIPWSRYALTKIFPEDLSEEDIAQYEAIYPRPISCDAPQNLIALSTEEADKYRLAPTPEKYKRLYEIKRQAVRQYDARSKINRIALEEDIRIVLTALNNPLTLEKLPKLEYSALRIDAKITDVLLKNEVQQNVLQYYRFIESTFSDSTDHFDEIAAAVRLTSQKLEHAGYTQAQVIEELSEWVRAQSKLGTRGQLACRIVVYFFIQNCEVFYQ